MAKWKVVTFEELSRLTRSQLVTMAMGQLKERKRKELYEAAKRDAEEAEAYAAELEQDRRKTYEALLLVSRLHSEVEAKLEKAVEALETIAYGGAYTDMQIARTVLAELKGQDQ